MGCCESKVSEKQPDKLQTQAHANNSRTPTHHPNPSPGSDPETGGAPPFSEFSFSDLKAATNNFSSDYIVSESGEKAPNLVYKGRLQNRRWIAVKKFTKMAWPDPKQFAVSLFMLLASLGLGLLVVLVVFNRFVKWVCEILCGFLNFWAFAFVGGSLGCWEAEASEACEFNWVLL